tara:strand:- start:4929 stop:5135 length:207 start_codon:yes stop_codon:yes gene_type:complete
MPQTAAREGGRNRMEKRAMKPFSEIIDDINGDVSKIERSAYREGFIFGVMATVLVTLAALVIVAKVIQ